MSQRKLRIYVEGEVDKIIISFLLKNLGVNDDVEILSCNGKKEVARQISGLRNSEELRHIALIDSDILSVPDSAAEAQKQLGDASIPVFCAVPEIESWLFADDLSINRLFDKTKREDFVARLPLPEMIVYPRLLARNIFPRIGPLQAYAFLQDINVNRAASRSPSLRTFLSGVLEAFDRPSLVHADAMESSLSRDVLSTLMRELPADTVVWKTVDGDAHTAKQLAKAIGEGEIVGRQFVTELLRIARDMIVRKARK